MFWYGFITVLWHCSYKKSYFLDKIGLFDSFWKVCTIHSYADIRKYLRIFLNVSLVFLCVFLYWRCFVVLKASQTINRSATLTKSFAAILLSWVVLVLPYDMFFDFSTEEHQVMSRLRLASMMMIKVYFLNRRS